MPYPSAKEIVLPSKKELFDDEYNENAIENQMLDLFSLFGDIRAAAFSVAFFSRDTHRQILLSTDNELRMRITL